MRSVTTRLLLVCLPLLGCFGTAAATELRQLSPESGARVADVTVAQPDSSTPELDGDGAMDAAPAARTGKPTRSRSPAPARAASDNRTPPARFHSFLPGMFR